MNIKKLLVFIIGLTCCFAVEAQTTIVLRPGSELGKDAYLRDLTPDCNYGTHPDFLATAWTFYGTPVTVRGIIDFDLSSIPENATIMYAHLSLYSYFSPINNGGHSTLSGSNEALLKRVTESWNESTVTWNTQPSTTSQNEVILPPSTNTIQHYPDIDVTYLVQDMVDDPINSHGFFFKLVTEEYYRRMLFASSDNSDTALHPKLTICYRISTDTPPDHPNQAANINIYPIPANKTLYIEIPGLKNTFNLKIYDGSGNLVEQKQLNKLQTEINILGYEDGIYYLFFLNNGNKKLVTKKIIIQKK